MQDYKKYIVQREVRIQEVMDYFKYPRELVEALFKYSKEYFEGAWHGYGEEKRAYYCSPFYLIRQMSYCETIFNNKQLEAFVDNIKPGESVLDVGCGVGDYLIIMAQRGVKCYGIEHAGTPGNFLQWRAQRYGVEITLLEKCQAMPMTDYAMFISSLDHLENPIKVAEIFCEATKKEIFATPCIDETYDRPTHEKHILKDVPRAFQVIRAHNERVKNKA